MLPETMLLVKPSGTDVESSEAEEEVHRGRFRVLGSK